MLDLPRTKPGFVGRSNELNRLRGGLGEYPIVAVEGQAGTGKTSLILELANELREKGRSVLWVQAREGWSTESVLLVLSQHWDIEFPPHLSTRQHLVRLATALAKTKTYLFLDDFHLLSDRSTLFEMMKAHLRQVSVVLTGRTRVEADSIRRLDCAIIQLESLALDEVDRLLRQMLERHGLCQWLEPSLFGELKEKSLGSPLLCKLLVSLLLQGRLSTLKDLHLAQEEIYGLLIAELEQGLGAEELDLLRRLSVYRLPVPREALPEGESTDECLERLVDRLLVEPTPGRRFTVHDVFRDYYQSHLEDSRLKPFHALCADFHAAREEVQDGKEAIHHYWSADLFVKAAESLCRHGKQLYQSAQYDFLLHYLEKLIETADSYRTGLLILKAEILAMIGGTEESLELFSRAERESTDVHQQIRALNSRCHLVLEQGELSEAMELAERALKRLDGLRGRRPGRVKALNGKALALARQGLDHPGSLLAGTASVEIAREISDPRGECYAHYSRALVYRHRDEWAKSLVAAGKAIEAAGKAREARLGFLARFLEGTALYELGRKEEAEQVLVQAYLDSEDYPDPLSRSLATMGYAFHQTKSAEVEQGLELSREALKYGAQHGGRVFVAQLFLTAGQIAECCEAWDEAGECYASGLARAERAGAWPLKADLAIRLELLRSDPDPSNFSRAELEAEKHGWSGVVFRAQLGRAYVLALAGKKVSVFPGEGWKPGADDLALAGFLAGSHKEIDRLGVWRPLGVRLSSKAARPFLVTTNDGAKRETLARVKDLRARRDEFELWLDVPEKTVIEKSKGKVNLLRRKVLTRLLLGLLREAGTPHTQEEIFLQVWGPPFQDESSAAQVRKNISALRDLLEPERSAPRYIKVEEGAFARKGGYFFCPGVRFCLIEAV